MPAYNLSNYKTLWNELGFFQYVIIVLVIYIVFYICLLAFTRFERKITVDTNTSYGKGNSMSNLVSDKEGRIYRIANVPLMLHFTAAEVQAKLKPGESFTVHGFGVRIPFLGMYPVITYAA